MHHNRCIYIIFQKDVDASYSNLFKELKNDIDILVIDQISQN